MKVLAFLSVGIFFIFLILNIAFPREWLFSLAITFATISYHFWMRLIVGYIVNKRMDNKADYTKKWFQLRPAESHFYEMIKVKKWKGNMPSYDLVLFVRNRYALNVVSLNGNKCDYTEYYYQGQSYNQPFFSEPFLCFYGLPLRRRFLIRYL